MIVNQINNSSKNNLNNVSFGKIYEIRLGQNVLSKSTDAADEFKSRVFSSTNRRFKTEIRNFMKTLPQYEKGFIGTVVWLKSSLKNALKAFDLRSAFNLRLMHEGFANESFSQICKSKDAEPWWFKSHYNTEVPKTKNDNFQTFYMFTGKDVKKYDKLATSKMKTKSVCADASTLADQKFFAGIKENDEKMQKLFSENPVEVLEINKSKDYSKIVNLIKELASK